jgi:sugar (pentulose or hexulose) kinase
MQNVAIFDIGKTNKKCFVFDEDYQIVCEKLAILPETVDEDGFPCEDIQLLSDWVKAAKKAILQNPNFNIKAINISAYGASFVYLDNDGEILTPLYNYLKPCPENLTKLFYHQYGEKPVLARETASPALGNLNSGLQLFRIKHEQPDIFNQIKYALHLPQYIHYLITGEYCSEITSIGCHTMLWDFEKNDYHRWVKAEGIDQKFPALLDHSPIKLPSKLGRNNQSCNLPERQKFTFIQISIGLHDSSAALIPYLKTFQSPFLLLSTGTWSIALNPFNQQPLTQAELEQDCLCYLSYEGKPVKASRLFAGHEHSEAIKRLGLEGERIHSFKDLERLGKAGEAYFRFLTQLVEKQAVAITLVLTPDARQIFVDGGFSKNEIFMTLLAEAFPDREVFAAEVPQASALGAAVAVHEAWNNKPLPVGLVSFKRYYSR